jgi:excisionase family DNA binding protein
MVDIPNKRYFRPDELARILEQPLRTIYFWLKNNKIKHLHYGKRTVVPREEICRIIKMGIQ